MLGFSYVHDVTNGLHDAALLPYESLSELLLKGKKGKESCVPWKRHNCNV